MNGSIRYRGVDLDWDARGRGERRPVYFLGAMAGIWETKGDVEKDLESGAEL